MHEVSATTNAASVERALIVGDLSKLSAEERVSYYNNVCISIGLNPLTRPLEYIVLNGKMVLYAKKDCTEQLRKIHKVSLTIVSRELLEGVYVVVAGATLPTERKDESIGAVSVQNLKGDAMANAIMKAETKAKRRVTLSICGLGFLDETEVETIPNKVIDPTAAAIAGYTEEQSTGGYDKNSALTETELDAQRVLEERRADGRRQNEATPMVTQKINESQKRLLFAKGKSQGYDNDAIHVLIKARFAKDSVSDLTYVELDQALKQMEGKG